MLENYSQGVRPQPSNKLSFESYIISNMGSSMPLSLANTPLQRHSTLNDPVAPLSTMEDSPAPRSGMPMPPVEEGGPVAPLPSPGEGGPVYPEVGIPVAPLPSPGEGGPVYPVYPDENIPVVPLPSPGEGGPVYPVYPDGGIPVVPLPSPGEGGPVYPSPGVPVIPLPPVGEGGPVFPGEFPQGRCFVRFLNAVPEEPALTVAIGTRRFVNGLSYAQFSRYRFVPDGFHVVTVTAPRSYGGQILLQRTVPMRANDVMTFAIITTDHGLDLLGVQDFICNNIPQKNGCIRVCNLSQNAPALDLLLADGRVAFSNVYFKEVTLFKTIRPAIYDFYVTPSVPYLPDIDITASDDFDALQPAQPLVSFRLKVRSDVSYTVYLVGVYDEAITVLVGETKRN